MYLLYLDASGTAELSDHTKHYVLVGACVHEGTWFALSKRIRGLKKRYAFPGEDFELHTKDFNTVIDGQAEAVGFDEMSFAERRACVVDRQKKKVELLAKTGEVSKARKLAEEYRRQRSFVHLSRAERSRLYEDALDLIGNHQGITLFAEAVDKTHPAVTGGRIDPTKQAFEQVVSRFDSFLERKRVWRKLSNPRSRRVDTGLIVMDSDYAKEREIERQFRDFRQRGHPWGKLRHVIETPFFVASEKMEAIQIVDVCAYAVRRYLDKGAIAGSYEEQHVARILLQFDRHDGRLHGIRHYTEARSCMCFFCRERGHGVPDGIEVSS
jgi:soluble cytochrome b562